MPRYSGLEKKLILETHRQYGRKEMIVVARLLGMSVRSADSIVYRSHLVRTSVHSEDSSRVKIDVRLGSFIEELLDRESTLTLNQVKELANQNILENIIMEDGSDSSFSNILCEYERKRIRSCQTILNFLRRKDYTRKMVVTEKTSANTEQAKAVRFKYAVSLLQSIMDEGREVFFLDEMPFYLSSHTSRGYARRGKRAVTRVLPGGTFSFKVQVAMVVHEKFGLVHGDMFSRLGAVTEIQAKAKVYDKGKFLQFLDKFLVKIQELDLREKCIVVIYDNAAEHGRRDEDILLKLPGHDVFVKWMMKTGCTIEFLRSAPNSPQLNLCELYNRVLRVRVNQLRHYPVAEMCMEKGGRRGSLIKHRLHCLCCMIATSMTAMKKKGAQTSSSAELHDSLINVIANNGYMDWHRPG